MDDAELLSRRAVDVLRHFAIGELNADGGVQTVVAYVRYPAPGIAHEGACAVVNNTGCWGACRNFLLLITIYTHIIILCLWNQKPVPLIVLITLLPPNEEIIKNRYA